MRFVHTQAAVGSVPKRDALRVYTNNPVIGLPVKSALVFRLFKTGAGIGPSAKHKAPVCRSNYRIKLVFPAVAVSLVPYQVPLRVYAHNPIIKIPSSKVFRLLKALTRPRPTAEEEAAVFRGDYRPKMVFLAAAVGFVPQLIASRVDAYNPIISGKDSSFFQSYVFRLFEASVGYLPAPEKEAAVTSGCYRSKFVSSAAAVCLVPQFVALCVYAHDPVITTTISKTRIVSQILTFRILHQSLSHRQAGSRRPR